MTSAPSKGPWPGRFVWHDLMTRDGARAQQFYVALLGWRVEEVPMGPFTYRMIHCGPGPIGGIVEEQDVGTSHWMPHLAVLDIDDAVRRLQRLGGSVRVPPTEIPDTGRFAMVGDPQGACFSIYQGRPESQGFDPDLGLPGRVCWNELYTSDPRGALQFYGGMLGWRDEPQDMGPLAVYHVQVLDGRKVGGLMQHPLPGQPSCWVVYFLVVQLEAATRKAIGLGATPMMENTPIPGIGAFSLFSDPTGAMFALFEPASQVAR